MPWFLTAYWADGRPGPGVDDDWVGSYGGYLWARDMRQARRFAKRRALNESVHGRAAQTAPYVLPSQWLAKRRPDPKKVFHALCWMGHLALKSGVATADEILGDEGVVHQYAHVLAGAARRAPLIEAVKAIERRIPGFLTAKEAQQCAEGSLAVAGQASRWQGGARACRHRIANGTGEPMGAFARPQPAMRRAL